MAFWGLEFSRRLLLLPASLRAGVARRLRMENRWTRLARIGARILSAAVFLRACVIVAGWCLEVPVFATALPGLPPTHFNTALCFMAVSVGVWLAARGAGAVASASLIEYAFNIDLGINQLLVRDFISAPGLPAGRMSIFSAVNLLLAGTAIWLILAGRAGAVTGTVAIILTVAGTSAALEYLFGAHWLYAWPAGNVVALPSALSFSALGLALLGATPRHDVVRWLSDEGWTGQLARRLMLAAIGVPLLFGAVHRWGERRGFYGQATGDVLMTLSIMAVFATLVLLVTRQLRRGEEELRRSDHVSRGIIESSHDGIQLLDTSGRARLVNHRGLEMLGWTNNDPAQRLWLDAWSGQSFDQARAAFEAALEKRTGEFVSRLPGIPARWGDTVVSPVLDHHGEVESVLVVTRDMTDRIAAETLRLEAQEQLEAHAAQLEEAVRRRTIQLEHALKDEEQLCYTIAHDLRAPLRAMHGFSKALADDFGDKLDPTAADYTRRILRATQRMDNLITDLLAYGRLGTGDGTPLELDLDALVEDLLAEYAPEINQHAATITVDNPLGRLTANRTLLAQALANLILNALKFVPPGVAPRARVFTRTTPGHLRLCVEDNGIGIAPEHRSRLFQVFHRLHSPEQYPGTGLGLAMVRKAAERMGGTAGFESTPGRGSTFWIELPLNHSQAAP
jgi:PAS domain S-box-containing protein